MNSEYLAEILLYLLCGGLLGALTFWAFHRMKLGTYQKIGQDILYKAEMDAQTIKSAGEITLKQALIEQQRECEFLLQNEKKKLQKEEDRLKSREDKLEARMNLVEKKLADIEKKEAIIIGRKQQIDEERKIVSELHENLIKQLESLTGLSSAEAKELLLSKITNDIKNEAAHLSRKIRKEAEEQAEQEAKRIIVTSINRLAVPCVSEATVNTVTIPNDEMKGRIIGREGRNIRALEHVTGINFIIDDTPGAIVLSGFDPIRMQIAKMALSELVKDGRIHPTRIEEVVEKAKLSVNKLIRQYGEEAAFKAGAMNISPELITLLGKLKFRFSYGQNVLDHSLEVSYIMGSIAAELGADIRLAKRIGLLHDIGKAVSHEVEGSHDIIGHDLCLKFGESKEVANGVGCHHFKMEPITLEAAFINSADAMSASRQGARSEPVEEYIKRLKKLEDIAYEFSGVDKAFAMEAGREIRVIVSPEVLDDAATSLLTKDLTKRIENELSYPGKIKVMVIREKRVIEYAL
jgi:ribonucrease Y